MTAIADNRKSDGEGTGLELAEFANEWNGPIAASTHLYKGTLAGVLTSDTSTDYPGLHSFVGDTTMDVRGFVEFEVDNSSGAKGARPCRVRARTGTLIDKNAGGGSAITIADLYKPIYGVDNQTCSKLVADGVPIGILAGIDPDSGNPVVFVSPLIVKMLTVLPNTGITFTQTYSTASATVAAVTSHSITDNSTGSASTSSLAAVTNPDLSAWNGSTDPTSTQATAINAAITALKNNISTLAAEQALVKADLLAAKQNDNKIIDTLQAADLAG